MKLFKRSLVISRLIEKKNTRKGKKKTGEKETNEINQIFNLKQTLSIN